MKKIKRRISSVSRSTESFQINNVTNKPSKKFIKEMVCLFKAGNFEQVEQKANEAIQRWPGNSLGWKALGDLMLMQGRHEDALTPLSNIIKLDPKDAQAHSHMGIALFELGRLEEAEASYRQALMLNPDFAQAHNNLGNLLLQLKRLEEAVASYQQALVLNPNFVEAHNNLGNLFLKLGRLEEAETSYRQLLVLKHDFAEAHNNLGNVLLKLGRYGEAETSYRKALLLKPDYAQAHSSLGDALTKLGRLIEAIASYRQGIALDPTDIKARDWLNHVLSRRIPLWHVPMMNDKLRNEAYFSALRTAITPDTHVLEIGTGSGLLAMMAAKLGAQQVTTCEDVSVIAETARSIIEDNGFSPSIKVVSKMSTKMEIGVDMEERADLLISEILSSEFLGEGVLFCIEDAKRRLLKPDAPIIPARGSIQFALFGGASIENNIRVGEVYGFNLSKFNAIVAPKQYVHMSDLNIELLTDDASAFFFDFQKTDRFPTSERKSIEVTVRQAGRCCGIIQWIRLDMDDSIVFENHPLIENSSRAWQPCVYVFPSPIDVMPGQVAVISAAHNGDTPWFFFEGLN